LLAQLRYAEVGDGQASVVSVPLEPANFEEAGEQSGRKGSGKVRLPFGPVETVSSQHPPCSQNWLGVESEVFEESEPAIGQPEIASALSTQCAAAEQSFAKGNAGPAGEVVVAASRFGQGSGRDRLSQRTDLHLRCDQAECLDGSRDERSAKPEVAVAAARPDRDKSAGR